MDFPEEIIEAVHKLRSTYRYKNHCVTMMYPIIEILRYEKEKEISVKFFYNDGAFEMQVPDYRYYSTISHFDYKRSERRWSRNKIILFSLLRDLKRCGLWNYVSNKDMIIVNSMNPKTNPKELMKILRAATD